MDEFYKSNYKVGWISKWGAWVPFITGAREAVLQKPYKFHAFHLLEYYCSVAISLAE